eukprot:920647-Alexandrium_andersonii.AAC.1
MPSVRWWAASSKSSRLAPLLGSGVEAPEPPAREPVQLKQPTTSQTARLKLCAVSQRRGE